MVLLAMLLPPQLGLLTSPQPPKSFWHPFFASQKSFVEPQKLEWVRPGAWYGAEQGRSGTHPNCEQQTPRGQSWEPFLPYWPHSALASQLEVQLPDPWSTLASDRSESRGTRRIAADAECTHTFCRAVTAKTVSTAACSVLTGSVRIAGACRETAAAKERSGFIGRLVNGQSNSSPVVVRMGMVTVGRSLSEKSERSRHRKANS